MHLFFIGKVLKDALYCGSSATMTAFSMIAADLKSFMELKNTINRHRRSLLHVLTKNIGSTEPVHTAAIGSVDEIKKILICRPNHRLGNLLLMTPLVQDLERIFPHCTIDLFVKGQLGEIVFENYKSIDKIISLPKSPFKYPIEYLKTWLRLRQRRYDLVINVDPRSSSGRLSTKLSRSRFRFFGDVNNSMMNINYDDLGHTAKAPVYNLRYFLWGWHSFQPKWPVADLNLKLSQYELSEGRKLVREFPGHNHKVIALFTYATGAKCYSKEWWGRFYEELKLRFPGYWIIEILPAEYVSQINFEAFCFYSRDVREIGAVLANVEVFIGADSGIMHLASAAGVPVIGLFSVTSPVKYEPYNSTSIALDTNKSTTGTILDAVAEILDVNISAAVTKSKI